MTSSLRGLYNSDPSSAWLFQSSPAPANSSTPQPPPSTPSYQWSSRPSHNSIFDLSPELADPSDGIDPINLLKTLAASAILQYASSAIAMPWEVGKLLLQVQWIPRDAGQPDPLDLPPDEDDEDALSDTSNDNDSYFADPNATPAATSSAQRPTDEQGYVIRRSVLDESTRPEYIIPVGSANGVWGMMRRVGRSRGEGWLALWKGLLTSCITEILSSTFQPMIRGLLQALLLSTTGLLHQPPMLLPVFSHLIMGFILSPLDLVRTRLIVQSFSSHHRTYKGPFDALSTILHEEGGLKGIYLHPHLLIPTIIDNLLPPIVSFVLPGMLASYVGVQITEDANPIAWGFAELAGSCLGLIITLPFETVRRRLQIQVRGTAKPIKGCVELRPVPYNGVVDAFWHILTEERSDLPIVPSKRRRRRSSKGKEREDQPVQQDAEEQSWLRNTGIGQLYRGLGMRLGASVIMFGLALFSGDESDGGWAEL